MTFYADVLTLLHTLFLLIYDHAPWLVWTVAMGVGTLIWLYACALVNAAWRLCTSQDERDWFRFLREAKRDHRRQEWARAKAEWRTNLWHKGDGPVIMGLLALALVVIAVCR
jgi:hypothetical protein